MADISVSTPGRTNVHISLHVTCRSSKITVRLRGHPELRVLSVKIGGTRWRSWLRHCATGRKVKVSIPDGVITIFH